MSAIGLIGPIEPMTVMMAMLVSPTIQTASIGIPDTMFLMVLALIVFGPRRLPEIGRQIGKLMYEFRKVSNDFKFQMEEELRANEEAARQQKLEASKVAVVTPVLESPLSNPPVSELPISETPVSPMTYTPPVYEKSQAAQESASGPVIHPPAGGDPVMAQRPFRGRVETQEASSEPSIEPTSESIPETVTESGSESGVAPEHASVIQNMINAAKDEGRIGTEVQPGVTEGLRTANVLSATQTAEEQEARHA